MERPGEGERGDVFKRAPDPAPQKRIGGARSASGGLSRWTRYQAADRAGAVGGAQGAGGWDYARL